jgi:ketopantoate reductase
MTQRSVLVVGAGAVGQVFGHHLALGGAHVTYFVREQYRAHVQQGFALRQLGGRHSKAPVHESGFSVVTRVEELRGAHFQHAYFTLSSTAIRGSWLRPVIGALGDATIVALQPTREDWEVVRAAGIPTSRLVAGSIGLVSYAAPLPGEKNVPGPCTSYWLPPGVRSLFSGPDERTRDVVHALKDGGLPAHKVADVHALFAQPTALGMTYLLALEACGFHVATLERCALLKQCTEAMREVSAIVAARDGRSQPGLKLITHPLALRALLAAGRRLAPFPLEPYLQRHFSKVREQTHLILANIKAAGDGLGLSTSALTGLMQSCPTFRPPRVSAHAALN